MFNSSTRSVCNVGANSVLFWWPREIQNQNLTLFFGGRNRLTTVVGAWVNTIPSLPFTTGRVSRGGPTRLSAGGRTLQSRPQSGGTTRPHLPITVVCGDKCLCVISFPTDCHSHLVGVCGCGHHLCVVIGICLRTGPHRLAPAPSYR